MRLKWVSTAGGVVLNSVREASELVGIDASNIAPTVSYEDRRWSPQLKDDVLVVDERARICMGMRMRMWKDKRNRI